MPDKRLTEQVFVMQKACVVQGIRKLQISNAPLGRDKPSLFLGFRKAEMTGFSNTAVSCVSSRISCENTADCV
jgi:hypothetical protein